MAWRRLAGTLGALAAAAGCQDRGAIRGAAGTGGAPHEPPTFVAAVDVSSVAAFDLLPSPEGAALLHGRPSSQGGGVAVLSTDRQGRASGGPVELASTPPGQAVVELSAAATGTVALVAWRTTGADGGTIFGARGSLAGAGWRTPVALAAAGASRDVRRGHLDVAISDAGRAVVLHRTPDAPCGEGRSEPCTALRFHSIDDGGAASPGLPLSVPDACQPPIAGLSFVGERWHYAVCSRATGRAETTVFAIQYEPEYATAMNVLGGCEPEGVTRAGDTTVVVGRCGPDRRGVLLRAGSDVPDAVDLRDVAVRCASGGPELSARSLTLPLRGAAGRLGPLLPPHVAPPGSRAVWTGTALLVAVAVGRTVEMRRHECVAGHFERTDRGEAP